MIKISSRSSYPQLRINLVKEITYTVETEMINIFQNLSPSCRVYQNGHKQLEQSLGRVDHMQSKYH